MARLPGVVISPNHKTVIADLMTAEPKIIKVVNSSFKQMGDNLLLRMQQEYDFAKPRLGTTLKKRLRHVSSQNPRDPRIPLRTIGWVLLSGDATDVGSHTSPVSPHKGPINKGYILGVEYGAHYEGMPNIAHISHWASKNLGIQKRSEANRAAYFIAKRMEGTSTPPRPVVTAVYSGDNSSVVSSIKPEHRSALQPVLQQLRKSIRNSMNRNSK